MMEALTQIIQEKEKEIASLKLKNNYLLNMISIIPGNIFWKNKEGEYLGCNWNVARILGLNSPEEIIGKKNMELMDEEFASHADQKDREAMFIASENSWEEAGFNIDKQPAVYLTKKTPLFDNEGSLIGLLGISFDITERKRIEKELKLEKEKAERASQNKSDFIANMSHDMKTPLSGIIGLAELLKSDLEDQQSLPLSKAIHSAGQQLLAMFNHYLDSFKSIHQDELLVEDFNLKSVLDEIYELYLPAVKVKNLELVIHYDEALPQLMRGNKINLYRILLNLVGNAIKFTKQGSVTMSVKVKKWLSDTQKAIIEIIISDTGMGIPQDKQTIIFEKFTRLTPAAKGLFEGSGMGLYIVKKAVTAIDGDLFLKSKEGEGSQFIVHLPLQLSESTVDHIAVSAEHSVVTAARAKIITHHKLKILLVEDNKIAQLVAFSMLTGLYCDVEIAETGEIALGLIEKNSYDLILLDIGLPGMQGDEIARQVRKLEMNREGSVPIVALTAHTESHMNYSEAGIDNVLVKPLSKLQVEEIINLYFIRA